MRLPPATWRGGLVLDKAVGDVSVLSGSSVVAMLTSVQKCCAMSVGVDLMYAPD